MTVTMQIREAAVPGESIKFVIWGTGSRTVFLTPTAVGRDIYSIGLDDLIKFVEQATGKKLVTPPPPPTPPGVYRIQRYITDDNGQPISVEKAQELYDNGLRVGKGM